MNVLVACEFSGIVREAFIAKGHNAWSCDLFPTEQAGNHIRRNVIKLLYETEDEWDLLIAHPPCTYLCNSGSRWLKEDDTRWKKMEEAVQFFNYLRTCNIPKICVENPIPHGYALNLIGAYYDQIIQPWWFGHKESKATCLWLTGLPQLQPTNIVIPDRRGKYIEGAHLKTGWMDRSRTYQGIADAMAEQWG